MAGKLKLILMLVLIVALYACGNDQSNSKILPTNTDVPDQIMTDLKISFTDSSFTKATLKADSGFAFSEMKRTILVHNIKVDFFTKDKNDPVSTLTSDSVIVFDDTKNMTAIGNVHVYSSANSTSLYTKQLIWDNKTRKIYSSYYVKIISPQETLEGTGFESDEHLSYYKILNAKGHN